ncbi:MAG TPA: hypothetical protein VG457_17970 [Planctomycetota bacterium]|nr:hypothetical protein [Planctomycetota bacterium]
MSWLENMILQAWEEGWSREEVENLLAVLEDLREAAEDRKWPRRKWLRGMARVKRPPLGLKNPEAPSRATKRAERRSPTFVDLLLGGIAKFLGRIVG